MIIDPYKAINKNVKVEKLSNRTEKIVNEMVEFLIDDHSQILYTSGFDNKNRVAADKIIREKLSKEYNYGNFDTEELIRMVLDRIFGYHILQKHIDDKETSDIRAIRWNSIYVMRRGKWEKTQDTFSNETDFYNFVRYCVLKNNGRITHEQPITVVSDKENHLRIEAGISPVNIVSPSLVIRIHRPEECIRLEDLCLEKSMMSIEIKEFLEKVVKAGCNLIVAGKGGSGKTTLLRACLEALPENIAITSNEETAELYCHHENMIQREIIKNRVSNNILLEDLTRQSLVMSNDAIVIGELKGAEAMSFFDAISTGHIGYATVHAESAEFVLDRLVTLMKRDILAQQYTDRYLKELLSQSIDLIVYMKQFKIYEICQVLCNKEGPKFIKLFEYIPGDISDKFDLGRFEKRNEMIGNLKNKLGNTL